MYNTLSCALERPERQTKRRRNKTKTFIWFNVLFGFVGPSACVLVADGQWHHSQFVHTAWCTIAYSWIDRCIERHGMGRGEMYETRHSDQRFVCYVIRIWPETYREKIFLFSTSAKMCREEAVFSNDAHTTYCDRLSPRISQPHRLSTANTHTR